MDARQLLQKIVGLIRPRQIVCDGPTGLTHITYRFPRQACGSFASRVLSVEEWTQAMAKLRLVEWSDSLGDERRVGELIECEVRGKRNQEVSVTLSYRPDETWGESDAHLIVDDPEKVVLHFWDGEVLDDEWIEEEACQDSAPIIRLEDYLGRRRGAGK